MSNDTFNGQAFGAPPGVLVSLQQLNSPGCLSAKLSTPTKPVRLSVNGAGDAVSQALFSVLIPGGLIRPGSIVRASSLSTYSNSASSKNVRHVVGNVGTPLQSLATANMSTSDVLSYFTFLSTQAGDPPPGLRGVNTIAGLTGGTTTALTGPAIDFSQDWLFAMDCRWTAAALGEFIQLEAFLFELWP